MEQIIEVDEHGKVHVTTEAVTPELLKTLKDAIAEGEHLGPSVIPSDSTWTYRAVPGKAAIACRTRDTVGRRVTCWIVLETSVGRNAVNDAVTIAELLNVAGSLEALNERINWQSLQQVFNTLGPTIKSVPEAEAAIASLRAAADGRTAPPQTSKERP